MSLVKRNSHPIQLFIWFKKLFEPFHDSPKPNISRIVIYHFRKLSMMKPYFDLGYWCKTFEKWRKKWFAASAKEEGCIFLGKELEYNASAPFSFTPLWWTNTLHLYILSVKWNQNVIWKVSYQIETLML